MIHHWPLKFIASNKTGFVVGVMAGVASIILPQILISLRASCPEIQPCEPWLKNMPWEWLIAGMAPGFAVGFVLNSLFVAGNFDQTGLFAASPEFLYWIAVIVHVVLYGLFGALIQRLIKIALRKLLAK